MHITIPTANPWVPLRILALGKQPRERVDADVYLLTGAQPSLLPGPREGLRLTHSSPATASLLNDLRADKGMEWVPSSGWLTKLRVDSFASDLQYDLAVDATGTAEPSRVAAGLEAPPATPSDGALSRVGFGWPSPVGALAGLVLVAAGGTAAVRRRTAGA